MTQVCVETATGKTRVDKMTAVADVGKINNRLTMNGGLAHIGTGTSPFYNPDTRTHIAFFRPARVCFWVAFRQKETQIEIVNAWSHRMQVIPNTLFVPGTPTEPHNETIVCQSCDTGELGFFKNHVEYLGSRFDVVLPQCKNCGRIYISPDIARGRMAEVEKILEDK